LLVHLKKLVCNVFVKKSGKEKEVVAVVKVNSGAHLFFVNISTLKAVSLNT